MHIHSFVAALLGGITFFAGLAFGDDSEERFSVSAIALAPGPEAQIDWPAREGAFYLVETADDLAGPWRAASPLLEAVADELSWSAPVEVDARSGFYRVKRFSGATDPFSQFAIADVAYHEDLYAQVEDPETGEIFYAIVTEGDEGGIVVGLPFHPTRKDGGGAVSLSIMNGESSIGGKVFVVIKALPAGDGAGLRVLDRLQYLIDLLAAPLGLHPRDFLDTPADAIPLELISLVATQSLIEDANNPNSLREILEGTAPLLEGDLSALELADQMLNATGLEEWLELFIAELEAIEAARPVQILSNPAAMSEVGEGPLNIGNAATLHYYMDKQANAASHRSGPTGELLRDYSTVGGSAGVFGTPAAVAGLAFAAPGTVALMIWEYQESVYPSTFTDLEISHTPLLGEDDCGPYPWFANVTVSSNGYKMLRPALEAMLEFGGAVKTVGGLKGLKKGTAGAKEAATRQEMLGDRALDAAKDSVIERILEEAENSDFVSIPSHSWTVDISDEAWSEAEIPDNFTGIALLDHGSYEPAEYDTGALRISTRQGKFGSSYSTQTPYGKAVQTHVRPIQVEISPLNADAEPEEEIEFTATVTDSEQPEAFSWLASSGTILSTNYQGGGVHVATWRAPESRDELPATITGESLSTLCLRALPNAPKRSGIALVGGDSDLIVVPDSGCVEPGETRDLEVIMADLSLPPRINWEASAGSITPTGDATATFTAPQGGGPVTITAASEDNEDKTAEATLAIGDCETFQVTFASPMETGVYEDRATSIAIQPHDSDAIGLAGHSRVVVKEAADGLASGHFLGAAAGLEMEVVTSSEFQDQDRCHTFTQIVDGVEDEYQLCADIALLSKETRLTGSSGVQVGFQGSGSVTGNQFPVEIASYQWDFGGVGEEITHVFPAPPYRTRIELKVVDSNGHAATAWIPVILSKFSGEFTARYDPAGEPILCLAEPHPFFTLPDDCSGEVVLETAFGRTYSIQSVATSTDGEAGDAAEYNVILDTTSF